MTEIVFKCPQTLDEKIKMVENMERYGGGFVKALAMCFVKADCYNLERLYTAFPEIVDRYFTWGNEN
jgi:hypothetical protein